MMAIVFSESRPIIMVAAEIKMPYFMDNSHDSDCLFRVKANNSALHGNRNSFVFHSLIIENTDHESDTLVTEIGILFTCRAWGCRDRRRQTSE